MRLKIISFLSLMLCYCFCNAQVCNDIKGNYSAELDIESLKNNVNVDKIDASKSNLATEEEQLALQRIEKARKENNEKPYNFKKEVIISDNSLSVKLTPKNTFSYKCKSCKKINEDKYLIITEGNKEFYIIRSKGILSFDFENLKLILTKI